MIAHEITHLLQPFLVSISVMGELEAYEVQYQINQELGMADQSRTITNIHKLVSNVYDITYLTADNLKEGRTYILSMCPSCDMYKVEPGSPLFNYEYKNPILDQIQNIND